MKGNHPSHVAQLVGESFHVQKGCLFDSRSGHCLDCRFDTQLQCMPVETDPTFSPMWMFLSVSLSHQWKHVLDFSIYFLHQGSEFSVIVFSKRFSISGWSLLLPATPWCEGWWAWSCPRGSLICSHFLGFFFLLLFLLSIFSSLYFKSLIWFSASPTLP